MKFLIENAGAKKGFLILSNRGELRIEAEGAVDIEVQVLQSLAIDNHQTFPTAIVNYVAKTQSDIILRNATCEGIFTNEPYITIHNLKSVLCTPIINQNKFIGIIYLENNLATGAFTTEILEILKIIFSQAAISIENALLYQGRELHNVTNSQREEEQKMLAISMEEKTSALPTGTTPISTPAINAQALQSLRDMAGDKADEVLTTLIENYLEDTPPLLEAISNAVDQLDSDALFKSAHILRGLSATIGATRLSQICQLLEQIGRAGTIQDASILVIQIGTEFKRVAADLQLEHPKQYTLTKSDPNSFKSQEKTALILVVDDQQSQRLVLRHAMEKEGYEVVEALNGEQCLALCQQQLPNIILLDALMPVIDGFTCSAQLQANLGEQCPPVLMITTLNDTESVDRAFVAGVADYVTKPIHWAVLRQRVRRLLATSWTMNQLRTKIEQERQLMQQLEAVNIKLQRLASFDGLTQIANRRSLDEYLQHSWLRLAREQAPLSLILCDIDFFKAYNDTYGHQAGDECLKQVANIIQIAVKRPADLVARYGGEEFMVILPNTDVIGAVEVAQVIQFQLKVLGVAHTGSKVSNFVTLSFGVASVIPSSETYLKALIAQADQALYQAKLAGRDRIVREYAHQ